MEITVGNHLKLKFNGGNVDHFLELYLVNIEVNSSPIQQTILKTIHGFIQLARIVKCHEQVKDAFLTGLSLPNLHKKVLQ